MTPSVHFNNYVLIPYHCWQILGKLYMGKVVGQAKFQTVRQNPVLVRLRARHPAGQPCLVCWLEIRGGVLVLYEVSFCLTVLLPYIYNCIVSQLINLLFCNSFANPVCWLLDTGDADGWTWSCYFIICQTAEHPFPERGIAV
jgi:hypothetical protein